MHAAVEALATASLLVEAGDADRVVVVAVDDAGSVARALAADLLQSGAVALLVSAERSGARARIGKATLLRGPAALGPAAFGHLALLPLIAATLPRSIACSSPPDMFARVELDPL
jgi:hypothetical protein